MSLGPITIGKQKFYYNKLLISSSNFPSDANAIVTVTAKNSVTLINEGSGVIEYSFNGTHTHGILNPYLNIYSVTINDSGVAKIWFKLKSGAASYVHIQTDVTLNGSIGGSSGLGGNSASNDAFGRLRTSEPFTIFENKQLFDAQALIWDTSLVSGATSVYSANRASSLLSVSSTLGSKAIRQTKPRFNYQAGKSLNILSTFVMGAGVSGVSKRVGYFDGYNGIFVKNDGTVNSVVIRSNVSGTPVDNAIVQTDWNIDKFDGYGPSGIVLDITKSHILFIDVEWLGVGSVRVGFVINGNVYYAHKFNHANILSSVYMSTPNLPIRYEIENVSGSASSLEQICCSISSEGGYENQGLSFTADRGVAPLANVSDANLFPVISLRLDSTRLGAQVVPHILDILCTSSNATFKWALVVNPTIGGIDAASWQNISGSLVQYDVSRTLLNTVSGGYVLASGYGSQKNTIFQAHMETNFVMGSTIAGVSDQMVLAVQKISAGTDNFIASVNWKEYS